MLLFYTPLIRIYYLYKSKARHSIVLVIVSSKAFLQSEMLLCSLPTAFLTKVVDLLVNEGNPK